MIERTGATRLEFTLEGVTFLAAASAADATRGGASLSGGAAGMALFVEGLSRVGFPGQEKRADDLLVRAAAALEAEPMPAGLYAGFAGIAWAHNRRRVLAGQAPRTDDECQPVDEALAEALAQPDWHGHFDLITGLTGLAVYLLDRVACPLPRTALADVVRHLERMAVPDDDGLTWMTPPRLLPAHFRELGPDGVVDFGLAHGIPGPLAILAEIAAAGIERERCKALLRGGMSWLLAHRLEDDDGSVFPSVVVPGDTAKPRRARLAWCYGDAGVAVAMARIAALSGNAAWREAAREVALRAARRPVADSGIVDHCLCHGSASLYLAFDRLDGFFGDSDLREAAERWLGLIVADMATAPALERFEMMGESGRTNSPGLLEGPPGCALAVMDALGRAPAGWARWMLLDEVPRGSSVDHV